MYENRESKELGSRFFWINTKNANQQLKAKFYISRQQMKLLFKPGKIKKTAL